MYHEEGLSGKLDVAEELLCFENGVYDLSTGQYRPGLPEDKLSISTGYNYVAEGFGHRAAVAEIFPARVPRCSRAHIHAAKLRPDAEWAHDEADIHPYRWVF